MKNIFEKLFILVVGLFLSAGIIFVISGLRFILNFPFEITIINIKFIGFFTLNLVLIILFFLEIFRNTQKISLIALLILNISFFSSVFFNWNNTLDLWLGPSNTCGVFDSYDKEVKFYRARKSYIFLKNESKSILFYITQPEFEKLGVTKNDQICWHKWQSLENTQLRKLEKKD